MRDAQRYERLAAIARESGHSRVTGPRVHHWVKLGLLPQATIEYVAFGRRAIGEPPRAKEQLLALCAYRFGKPPTRLDVLGLCLWVDGFEVAERAVRAGLERLADLPGMLRLLARAEPDYQTVAQRLKDGFDEPRVPAADLAVGLGDFVAVLEGTLPPTDADRTGLEALGEVAGLGRAARDRAFGVPSRLAVTVDESMRKVAQDLEVNHLRLRISAMSIEELDQARHRADAFSTALVGAADRFAVAGRPRFSGLDAQAPALRTTLGRALAIIPIIAFPAGISAYEDQLAIADESGARLPRKRSDGPRS